MELVERFKKLIYDANKDLGAVNRQRPPIRLIVLEDGVFFRFRRDWLDHAESIRYKPGITFQEMTGVTVGFQFQGVQIIAQSMLDEWVMKMVDDSDD